MPKKHRTVTRDEKKRHHKKQVDELADLKQRVQDFDPKTAGSLTKFDDLPLSQDTLEGLHQAGYATMTDIQKEAIPMCLKGDDVLGAAKTGSGKTLAYLIPVLEKLQYERWDDMDGVGALVIAPTRELAVQIYEVLLKIGKFCSFSAGLVIGGKDYSFEKDRIGRMNILIGTPGRILQHMDESASLNMDNLQVLVFDEADRILDMGFRKTIDSIIGELPPQRQTLLFSATQTKSVQDLARLSLVHPKYITTSTDAEASTPESLDQFYINTPLNEKLDTLWSFIKAHLNSKIIVFVSSSKEVHFIFESFRKLHPGISLLKLHGRQKQKARLDTTLKFTHSKKCCLFATDVVARGLDFPAVDWVVQLDAPEDAATYIHRVGRAARFGRAGKSLLMLTPNEEEAFLKRLDGKKIQPKRLNVKGSKKQSIRNQLQSLCFESPELKYLGQKAFTSYCKSIFIQKDKDVFDLSKLPLEAYAKSLGLPGQPKIKFLEKAKEGKALSEKELAKINDKKNASRRLLKLSTANEDGEIQEDKKVRTKYDKMFERQNQSVLSEHYMQMTKGDEDDEDDNADDFLQVKRNIKDVDEKDLPELETKVTSKRALKKALSKVETAKKSGTGTKMVFDDEGMAHPIYELENEEDFKKAGPADKLKAEFLSAEQEVMAKEDAVDKTIAKGKRDEKKWRRKELERLAMEEERYDDEGPVEVLLGPPSDEEDEEEPDLERDLKRGAEESASESEGSEKEEEEEEREEPARKRSKKSEPEDEIIEIQQPETIDDLEALTEKLINE